MDHRFVAVMSILSFSSVANAASSEFQPPNSAASNSIVQKKSEIKKAKKGVFFHFGKKTSHPGTPVSPVAHVPTPPGPGFSTSAFDPSVFSGMEGDPNRSDFIPLPSRYTEDPYLQKSSPLTRLSGFFSKQAVRFLSWIRMLPTAFSEFRTARKNEKVIRLYFPEAGQNGEIQQGELFYNPPYPLRDSYAETPYVSTNPSCLRKMKKPSRSRWNYFESRFENSSDQPKRNNSSRGAM